MANFVFVQISEGGARSLFTTAVDSFPVDFVPLSMIAHSLSTAGPAFNLFVSQLAIYFGTQKFLKHFYRILSDPRGIRITTRLHGILQLATHQPEAKRHCRR